MATSPVKMVVQNLQERSRHRIMDGPRKFIMVENHEAVKVGEQDKNVESRKVVEAEIHERLSGSSCSGRADTANRTRRYVAHFHLQMEATARG